MHALSVTILALALAADVRPYLISQAAPDNFRGSARSGTFQTLRLEREACVRWPDVGPLAAAEVVLLDFPADGRVTGVESCGSVDVGRAEGHAFIICRDPQRNEVRVRYESASPWMPSASVPVAVYPPGEPAARNDGAACR